MDIKMGGIMSKLKKNADWAAYIVSSYSKLGGIDGMIDYHTHPENLLTELKNTLNTAQFPGLIKEKLWTGDNTYTGLIRLSVYAWLAAEVGLIGKGWQGTAKKIATGAGIAALTHQMHSTPHHQGAGGSSAPAAGYTY